MISLHFTPTVLSNALKSEMPVKSSKYLAVSKALNKNAFPWARYSAVIFCEQQKCEIFNTYIHRHMNI